MKGRTPIQDSADDERASGEFNKVLFLVVGTMALWLLVFVLVLVARVEWIAAGGFWAISVVSILIALGLGVPWAKVSSRMFAELLNRLTGSQELAERWTKRIQDSRIAKWVRRRDAFYARQTVGLWAPFIVNLIAVGWLICLSGGVVHSPFAQIPVVMFTLVVLLIDSPQRRGSGAGEDGSLLDGEGRRVATVEVEVSERAVIASDSEERIGVPFLVLGLVALSYYVALIAINLLNPWHGPHPADGATLTITVATAAVGVILAILARMSVLLTSRQHAHDHDGDQAQDTDAGRD